MTLRVGARRDCHIYMCHQGWRGLCELFFHARCRSSEDCKLCHLLYQLLTISSSPLIPFKTYVTYAVYCQFSAHSGNMKKKYWISFFHHWFHVIMNKVNSPTALISGAVLMLGSVQKCVAPMERNMLAKFWVVLLTLQWLIKWPAVPK